MATSKDLEHFKAQLKQARKSILDLLEVSLSEPQWAVLRSKVMEVFGRTGLEGGIDGLIRKNERNGAENESPFTS